ncbi:hypothetical protein CYMTET_20053 [Cymbomonas tetramitiformis]|uniref:Uncharacterized protein n=1 Tax=Cymbomonas tetramitiformis TaxID=36881 RepID=A0AAE0L1Y9_9CHLO|nr:hypothetical protein CYMTET_22389 [Cymbomonas tetramitiformis]KAK3271611.1 hypothetical protein CYMTET_20053 [Cymbomonas tetramitiformis]
MALSITREAGTADQRTGGPKEGGTGEEKTPYAERGGSQSERTTRGTLGTLEDKAIPDLSNDFRRVLSPRLRALILRCRHGTLIVIPMNIGGKKAPTLMAARKYTSPDCALCGSKDTTSHRLGGGCGHPQIKNMGTRRICEALRTGRTGAIAPRCGSHNNHAELGGNQYMHENDTGRCAQQRAMQEEREGSTLARRTHRTTYHILSTVIVMIKRPDETREACQTSRTRWGKRT